MELVTRGFSPLTTVRSDQGLQAFRYSFESRDAYARKNLLLIRTTESCKVRRLEPHFAATRQIIDVSDEDSGASSSLHHVVRKGETLTSIAREYDTSICSIAKANEITNIDFLLEGQVLLIPLGERVTQKMAMVLREFVEPAPNFALSKLPPKALMLTCHTTDGNTTLPALGCTHKSFLGSVQIFAPLFLLLTMIGFWMKNFTSEIRNECRLDLSKQLLDERAHDYVDICKPKRWQTIFDNETGNEEIGLVHDITDHMEEIGNESDDQKRRQEFEELRNSYASLEISYLKFLADSGLSQSGYWRGGVPSAAADEDPP